MTASRRGLRSALVLAVAGCGCVAEDLSGGPALGAGGAAAIETSAFDFVLYELDIEAKDLKGHPIAGALVALDLPSGSRQELLTDATGTVRIVVPTDVEYFTWTAAKSDRLPVRTFYRVTIDEVRAQIDLDGQLYSIMGPVPGFLGDEPTVSLSVSAEVPFCVSSTGAWHDRCRSAGTDEWAVAKSSSPATIVAYAIDEQGQPTELREVTLTDTLTDQAVELDFGGTDTAVPETFEVALQLPDDPTSPFHTGPFVLRDRYPFYVESTQWAIRGGAWRKQHDETTGLLDLAVSYYPREDDTLRYVIYLHAAAEGAGSDDPLSIRLFSAKPTKGTYAMLDAPVMSSPDGPVGRSSTFTWQAIDGAQMYWLDAQAAGGSYSLWTVASWRHQELRFPALPSGYDPAREWGVDRAGFRAWVCDRWIPALNHRALSGARLDWVCAGSRRPTGVIVE